LTGLGPDRALAENCKEEVEEEIPEESGSESEKEPEQKQCWSQLHSVTRSWAIGKIIGKSAPLGADYSTNRSRMQEINNFRSAFCQEIRNIKRQSTAASSFYQAAVKPYGCMLDSHKRGTSIRVLALASTRSSPVYCRSKDNQLPTILLIN
jgi:hypothetical protein